MFAGVMLTLPFAQLGEQSTASGACPFGGADVRCWKPEFRAGFTCRTTSSHINYTCSPIALACDPDQPGLVQPQCQGTCMMDLDITWYVRQDKLAQGKPTWQVHDGGYARVVLSISGKHVPAEKKKAARLGHPRPVHFCSHEEPTLLWLRSYRYRTMASLTFA
jgi:hypothetical protein